MRGLLKSPLLMAVAAAFIAVLSGDARQIEYYPSHIWYMLVSEPAPDDFVVVSLDGGKPTSASSISTSTERQAELVERLEGMGAGPIFLDMPFAAGDHRDGDERLYKVLESAPDRVKLVMRTNDVIANYDHSPSLPQARFTPPPDVGLASSIWYVNAWDVGMVAPASARQDGKVLPAAALLAAQKPQDSAAIYPFYRMNPETVGQIDGQSILAGKADPRAISGRTVFVTSTNGDQVRKLASYGHKRVSPALLDIAGAVGLTRGSTQAVGGYPFLIAFVLAVLAGGRLRRRSAKSVLYLGTVASLFVLPGLLRDAGFAVEFGSALVAAMVYVPLRAWRKWRERVTHTSSASGLPNVEALVAEGIPQGSDVVVVCISHFEQMLAALPRELHGECSRQIARRISVAASGTIFDNGDGHFIWLTQPCSNETLIAQLEGLKALFSAPLVIGDNVLDTNVHFGLDRNSHNNPISRIKAAIASSSEAESKLKLYEEFGQERLAEAPWELSLHARIDEALHNGDIWLAFQPQFDFHENRICGAEALIRWTDPERGSIPPDTFIFQAERAGRIEAITYWVLERALVAIEQFNAIHPPFEVSVNLSARMVDQPNLVSRIAEIVDRAQVDRRLLTFEVTETFNMTNHEVARENLAALRAMGFRLSIDDFGTGYASLAYLSEIPTDEIKLDRRFVSALKAQPRDHAISANIVRLAHSLGQVIVAEGVEDADTLELLRSLDCDRAQGYLIGRPVTLEDLMATLAQQGPNRLEYG